MLHSYSNRNIRLAHYFCSTLYTNLGHKVANFECHDIPLFCPSGPPCFLLFFCQTTTSAKLKSQRHGKGKTLNMRKFNFSRKTFWFLLNYPTYWVFFFFFGLLCTLQLKSP